MPPERRLVAKKSARPDLIPPQFRAQPPTRSESPVTFEDKILYIQRWGVNQSEACTECEESGLATRCFVAHKVGAQCGNCLRAGKQCHFPGSDDESEEDEEVHHNKHRNTVQEEVISIRRSTQATTKTRAPINLVNLDPDDDEGDSLTAPTNVHRVISSPDKNVVSPQTSSSPRRGRKPPKATVHRITAMPSRPTNPQPTPENDGSITPPLARADYPDVLFSPLSTSPSKPSELSLPQRNLIVMAIQNQIDWNTIANETGVDVDKILRWWMRASSDLVKRG